MGNWSVITGVQPGPPIRPTRAEVDLAAVAANAALIRRLAGVELWAVIKADAYGHGAVACAGALAGHASGVAVSLVEEGAELRAAGVELPILVMGPSLAGGHAELVARDMTAMVSDEGDLTRLAALGSARDQPVAVHIKVDTGMSRLGIAPARLEAILGSLPAGVRITGLATHFACADDDDPDDDGSMTARQLATFRDAVACARRAGKSDLLLHAANSAGVLRFPASRFDRARPGLALYGNGFSDLPLSQSMRLVTAVAQIRNVAEGETVSYGALWRAARPSRVAVLPVGYADGLPRSLTGTGEALVGGVRCPLVGAVSMDIALVDVTDLDAIALGDEAVLLGGQGNERITAAEFASRSGLTEYEVTCGISKRVPREYV